MLYHSTFPARRIEQLINPNRVPCVVRDTKIVTDQDEVPVQALRAGDAVFTPDKGFDTVVEVFTLPLPGNQCTPLLRYPTQSVGNYAELRVSPGCKVRPYDRGFFSWQRPNSVGLFALSHDLADDGEVFCYHCIVLESSVTVLANGAVVSTINSDTLIQLEERCFQLTRSEA